MTGHALCSTCNSFSKGRTNDFVFGAVIAVAVNKPMATPEYSTATDTDSFDVGETKVQHYGLLLKKPFGHKSARWQKR